MHNRALEVAKRLVQQPLVQIIVTGAVTCTLYASSLQVGFFNDDPTGHFRWMEGRSLVSLFTSASGYPFYRPLTFVLWKAAYALGGGYNPVGFHLLNVLFHALSAALVWALGYVLTGRWAYAMLAGLLFACFPFSYEAVAYAGALFHPLVTCLVLSTLLLYYESKQRRSNALFWAAHLTLVLALFAHENGIIAPLLILGWEFSEWSRGRPFNRRAWTFLGEAALFFGLWLVVPRLPRQGTLLQPLSAMRVSALYFFQAIVHPVAPLTLNLATHLSLNRDLALVVIGLVSLGLAYLIACRSGMRALFVLTGGWALLAALPAVLFLESEYIRGSPRLYYLTSVGTSLLWATVGLGLVRLVEGRSRWLRSGAYLIIAVLILALLRFDVAFVACRQHFYVRATELMQMVSRTAAIAPTDKELVYVNLPLYFSSAGEEHEECANPFPLGPSGAMAFPRYAQVSDFIFVNGGPRRPAIGITAAAFAPGWETYGDPVTLEQMRQFLAENRVYLCDLAAWRIFALSDHWQVGGVAESPGETRVTFGENIVLAGYEVRREDNTLRVILDWRCLAAPQKSYTVFVHLYGPVAGPPVAQQDGPPVHNYVPTSFWQAGDRIRDEKTVALPAGLPAGDYTLVVGLYDPVTGARLPAVGPDGWRYPNDAVPLYRYTLP
ncbi:MAG: hypothetical protein NUW24_15870 [Anaerolineae bacterium]|jgi:hypothetical protein|nr:hypothetical protein [Anaerolineae bacterium]MDH7475533.1 hypothetical protein [Anaerolineae bacterium]